MIMQEKEAEYVIIRIEFTNLKKWKIDLAVKLTDRPKENLLVKDSKTDKTEQILWLRVFENVEI